MNKENILLLGAGGHAHSCFHLAMETGQEFVGFLDDDPGKEEMMGLRNLGDLSELEEVEYSSFVLGLGDHDKGRLRVRLFDQLQGMGKQILGLISIHSNFAEQGYKLRSNQVFYGSIFGGGCIIGNNNIFNHGAIIEHQCKIGSHCHVGSGAVIAGGAMIGDQVLFGANSTLIPGIEINSGSIIGAGSVVTKSILESGGIYAGNPAKKIGEWDYEI